MKLIIICVIELMYLIHLINYIIDSYYFVNDYAIKSGGDL